MNRFPLFLVLLLGSLILLGADGCSSDPNVEGAKLDLNNKDYDRALENLDIAIEKNPDNAEAHQLRGQVLQEQAAETQDFDAHTEMLRQMVASYDRAVELDPTLQTDVDQRLRVAYFNEFQRGIQAFNKGKEDKAQYDSAVLAFDNAVMILPDSANAFINKAFALMNAGRSAEAIEPFEMALERGEDGPDTYIFLADLYRSNERFGDAVTLLEEARVKYPDDANVQAQLLNAYQVAGQMDRALQVYKETVERDPNNKLYRYNYGSILLQSEEYEAAREQLRAAISLDPDYAVAHYNLGVAFVNEAVAVNQRIGEIDDELRAKRSEMTQAQADAMDKEMNDLDGKRRGLFESAIPNLEQARTLMAAEGEDVQDICFALFQAYAQTGDTAKAQGIAECAGVDVN